MFKPPHRSFDARHRKPPRARLFPAGDGDLMRLALDAATDGAWDWNIETGDIYLSSRWLARLGYAAGEVPGASDSLFTLVHPDDMPAVSDALQAHLRGDTESFECEYRQRTADGAWLWNFDRGRVVARDATGRALRMVGTNCDVTARKEAEARLTESEAHYRRFIEVNPALFWTADPDGRVELAGERDARNLGDRTDLPEIGSYARGVHPDDRARVKAVIAKSLADGEPMDLTYRFDMRGSYRWVRTRAHARRDADGRILRWYGASEDVHRRKVAEDELRTTKERLQLALDGNRVGVWDWDVGADRLWLSDSAYALQGYGSGEVEADVAHFREVVHPDDQPTLIGRIRDALAGRTESFASEHRVRTKAGAWLWVADRGKVVERDADGRARRLVGTRTDISERRAAEARIRWMADHDALTGLPNRRLFQEVLGTRLDAARDAGVPVALLLLDVDSFKEVNDTLGHDAGDALLRTFADRLRASLGDAAFIARLGGDEFAVVLAGAADEARAEAAMAAIAASLRAPFAHDGRLIDCHAGIGASVYPAHGATADELLKSADVALYVAKSRGAGSAALFEPAMRSTAQSRSAMIRTAREAIDDDRVVPFYQPKVALGSGRLTGIEALLRWRDPSLGIQPPAAIGAAFEDAEVARSLTERMLDRITGDMRGWLDAGLDFGHVAINASAAEFRAGDFAERMLDRLAAADIPPDRVELEVTETVFLGRGAEHVLAALKTLSGAGVRIALDDFGTGYASLTHLKQFPVDTIKLDRSFIADLEGDPADAAIVRAILGLGQSLKIDIVAEGIETSVQAAYLWAQGCGFGQGYLFGRPAGAAAMTRRIAGWEPRRHWDLKPAASA